MKQLPKLEEVQEHFKNAKVVKCLIRQEPRNLDTLTITRDIHYMFGGYWIDYQKAGTTSKNSIKVWSETSGYAEILEGKSMEEYYEVQLQKLKKQTEETQKELEKIKKSKKPIAGRWYKWTGIAPMIGVISNESSKDGYYKFAYTVEGFDDNGYNSLHPQYLEPATREEVIDALKKEAEKRGFKEGVRHTQYDGKSTPMTAKGTVTSGWNGQFDMLHFTDSQYLIFKDGEWAKIVKESLPEVEGYQGEDKGDSITFGCEVYKKKAILNLDKMGITTFTINTSEGLITITEEQFAQIVNYIKNR